MHCRTAVFLFLACAASARAARPVSPPPPSPLSITYTYVIDCGGVEPGGGTLQLFYINIKKESEGGNLK